MKLLILFNMATKMYRGPTGDTINITDEEANKFQGGQPGLKNSGWVPVTPDQAAAELLGGSSANGATGGASGTGTGIGTGSQAGGLNLDPTSQALLDQVVGMTGDVSTSNTEFEQDLRKQAQELARQRREQINLSAESDIAAERERSRLASGGIKAQLSVGAEGAPGLSSAEIGLLNEEIKLSEKTINAIAQRRDKALLDGDTELYGELKDSYRNEEKRQEELRQARFTRLTTALSTINTAKSTQVSADAVQRGIRDDARQLILGLAGSVSSNFFSTLTTDEQQKLAGGEIPWSAVAKLNNAKLDQTGQQNAAKLKEKTAEFVVNNLAAMGKADPADIDNIAATLGISSNTLRNAIATKSALDVAKLQADIQRNNPSFTINIPTVGDTTGKGDTGGGAGAKKYTTKPYYVNGAFAGNQILGPNGLLDHWEDASGKTITAPPAGITFSSSQPSDLTFLLGNQQNQTTAQPDQIRVRWNATGETGTVKQSDFNPNTMTKL